MTGCTVLIGILWILILHTYEFVMRSYGLLDPANMLLFA